MLRDAIERRTTLDAVRTAEVATTGITPYFTAADFSQDFVPLDPNRVTRLNDVLKRS